MTPKQYEAILHAMFTTENEIQHLEYLIMTINYKQCEAILKSQLENRKQHYDALNDLLLSNKKAGE